MEKNKFLDEVKKRGYEALIDGGVVIVRYPGKAEAGIKEIRALAEKLDYNQSWGLRVVTDGSVSLTKIKPEEPKAEVTKPEDLKAEEDKPEVAKPAESKPKKVKPAETKSEPEPEEDFLDDSDGGFLDNSEDGFLDDDDDILSDIDSFKQISLFDFD